MLAEVSWILVLPASIFGIIPLVLTVALCLCGCKGKQHKDDLGGIEGHVKITNPEDFLNEVNANNIHSDITVVDKPQNTAKRSLPDLPVDQNTNNAGDGNWEANGDATSDLYATVVLQDEKNKKHERQKSESDSISASYAHLKKEHPYDKLKKVEHPYAQLKEHGSGESSAGVSHESQGTENKSDGQEDDSEPITPDRPHRESTGNIPAATAIAGHVTASDDLPYMTPPAHFSGDSQDSGKGYTSISVREPLSAIRAETKQSTSRRTDPHYATVSDDSDDMYAAIDDPNQVYTSESETYAQIQTGSKQNPAPQPPSVNSLKQMAVTSQTHSRQASSSSAASSTAVSSPKPEKRPANSPLPPPPATTTPDSTEDLYAFVDKKSEGSPRNLEDMYAKVNKKGRRDVDAHFERGASTESGASESSDSMSYKMQTNSTSTSTTTPSTDASRSCHSYKSTTDTSSSSTSNRQDRTGSSFSLEVELQPGYEKIDFDGHRSDPGYETVNKGPPSDSDPNYEQLKPQEHDYASIARTENTRLDRHESDTSDGYARVQSNPRVPEAGIYSKIDNSELDGYARVDRKKDEVDDGYAKVLKCNNNRLESNYERVLFDERVQSKHSDPVGEPTYESLGNEFEADDPNYESVHYLISSSAHIEPPYQLLRDCESGATTAKKTSFSSLNPQWIPSAGRRRNLDNHSAIWSNLAGICSRMAMLYS